MPRCSRLFVENACCHITARGNQKQDIFLSENDFKRYAGLLRKYKFRYGCIIYGYCLMPNHIHFIMEFPRGARTMCKFMHSLNQSYAMIFNKKYKKVGHLWQNRYKNFIVLKNEYLVNVMSYVEFNPIRAGLVLKPEDYAWSSYRARILGEKNTIIDTFKIDYFNADNVNSASSILPVGTVLDSGVGQI